MMLLPVLASCRPTSQRPMSVHIPRLPLHHHFRRAIRCSWSEGGCGRTEWSDGAILLFFLFFCFETARSGCLRVDGGGVCAVVWSTLFAWDEIVTPHLSGRSVSGAARNSTNSWSAVEAGRERGDERKSEFWCLGAKERKTPTRGTPRREPTNRNDDMGEQPEDECEQQMKRIVTQLREHVGDCVRQPQGTTGFLGSALAIRLREDRQTKKNEMHL